MIPISTARSVLYVVSMGELFILGQPVSTFATVCFPLEDQLRRRESLNRDYEYLYKSGVHGIFGPGTIIAESAIDILNKLLSNKD